MSAPDGRPDTLPEGALTALLLVMGALGAGGVIEVLTQDLLPAALASLTAGLPLRRLVRLERDAQRWYAFEEELPSRTAAAPPRARR